jgi:hypothetical protein
VEAEHHRLAEWSWSEIGDSLTQINKWSHSGVCVLDDDTVVVSTPGDSSISLIRRNGQVENISCGSGIYHGMAADHLQGLPFIWLADIGVEANQGKLLSLNLSTRELVTYTPAGLSSSSLRDWRPTSVAVERSISSPDGYAVWVADGYGKSLVHRLTASGEALTIDGSESGQLFDCPHGIAIDSRSGEPMLVVADRGNRRLVWYSLDGHFVRELKHELLSSPSALVVIDDYLYVTELFGGLVKIAKSGTVQNVLPRSKRPREGSWPNDGTAENPQRPKLNPGQPNSPHGIAANAAGSLVFTEWLIGGRTVWLDPAAPEA